MSPRDLSRTRKTYGAFRSAPIYEETPAGDTYIISGGDGGDVSASYILVTGTSSLPNNRALLAGTGLLGSDGGAGASYSLGINNAVVATVSGTTFTGITKHNVGLSGSLTKLVDGTSYIIAGSNITVSSQSNGAITISSTGGGSPGGTTPNIQYNNGGTLGGIPTFNYNSNAIEITGSLIAGARVQTGGDFSHAEGSGSIVYSDFSHAEGRGASAGANLFYVPFGSTNDIMLIHSDFGNVTSAFTVGHNLIVWGHHKTFSGAGDYRSDVAITGVNWDAGLLQTAVTASSIDALFDNNLSYFIADSQNLSSSLAIDPSSNMSQAHAEGENTRAFGMSSHTEGYDTTTVGYANHAEGESTFAIGNANHAEGYDTRALNDYAHAEGESTFAAGYASHAEGQSTIALGNYSHVEGLGTIASGAYQKISGKYNKRNNATSLFVVGNGTADDNASRSDVLRVETTGLHVSGVLLVSGAAVFDSRMSPTTLGSDVIFYVSGTISASTATCKLAVFGGDSVFSGSITVMSHNESLPTVLSGTSLIFPNVGTCRIAATGPTLVTGSGASVVIAAGQGTGPGGDGNGGNVFIDPGTSISSSAGYIAIGYLNKPQGVVFLGGPDGTSGVQATRQDIYFFVSGTIDLSGTLSGSAARVSVFGGDVYMSGGLSLSSPVDGTRMRVFTSPTNYVDNDSRGNRIEFPNRDTHYITLTGPTGSSPAGSEGGRLHIRAGDATAVNATGGHIFMDPGGSGSLGLAPGNLIFGAIKGASLIAFTNGPLSSPPSDVFFVVSGSVGASGTKRAFFIGDVVTSGSYLLNVKSGTLGTEPIVLLVSSSHHVTAFTKNNVTASLPTNAAVGTQLIFKDVTGAASTSPQMLSTSVGLIDGAATYTMPSTNYSSATVIKVNANDWIVV
jgi:hypothetical protein